MHKFIIKPCFIATHKLSLNKKMEKTVVVWELDKNVKNWIENCAEEQGVDVNTIINILISTFEENLDK